MCEPVAFDRVLEEDRGLYYVTKQGKLGNSAVFEVSSILLVLSEGHNRLPNSVSQLAETTIFAVDVVLWRNYLPSE